MSTPLLVLAHRQELVALLVLGPAQEARAPIYSDEGQLVCSGDPGVRARVEGQILRRDELAAVSHIVAWWGPRGCRWVCPTPTDREALLVLLPHDEHGALLAGDVRMAEAARNRTVRPDEVLRDAWPEASLVVEGVARAIERAALERARKAAA